MMEAEGALQVLTGHAHETRLGIFRLLVEVGHAGLLAGETIAQQLIDEGRIAPRGPSPVDAAKADDGQLRTPPLRKWLSPMI